MNTEMLVEMQMKMVGVPVRSAFGGGEGASVTTEESCLVKYCD